jgi:hypothetical protein
MFEELRKVLQKHNYGVRAYEQFSHRCNQSAQDQPDHAVFFLLLSVMADRFVNQYDESPLSITVANAQKDKVLGTIAAMEKILAEDIADQIKLLNAVSISVMADN